MAEANAQHAVLAMTHTLHEFARVIIAMPGVNPASAKAGGQFARFQPRMGDEHGRHALGEARRLADAVYRDFGDGGQLSASSCPTRSLS